MTIENLIVFLKDKIDEEESFNDDFYYGRETAFRLVIEMLTND